MEIENNKIKTLSVEWYHEKSLRSLVLSALKDECNKRKIIVEKDTIKIDIIKAIIQDQDKRINEAFMNKTLPYLFSNDIWKIKRPKITVKIQAPIHEWTNDKITQDLDNNIKLKGKKIKIGEIVCMDDTFYIMGNIQDQICYPIFTNEINEYKFTDASYIFFILYGWEWFLSLFLIISKKNGPYIEYRLPLSKDETAILPTLDGCPLPSPHFTLLGCKKWKDDDDGKQILNEISLRSFSVYLFIQNNNN